MPISASAKDLLSFIRSEKERRWDILWNYPEDERGDQWFTADLPFLNDLALMTIVTIRHDLERQLIRMAARITDDCKPIAYSEYLKNVETERKKARREGLKVLNAKLALSGCPEWKGTMDLLKCLVNCYKHDPWMQPDEDLLKKLNLNPEDSYMPLPESDAVRKAMAIFMCLPDTADYCDIAESMIKDAEACVKYVRKNVTLTKVVMPKFRLIPGQ